MPCGSSVPLFYSTLHFIGLSDFPGFLSSPIVLQFLWFLNSCSSSGSSCSCGFSGSCVPSGSSRSYGSLTSLRSCGSSDFHTVSRCNDVSQCLMLSDGVSRGLIASCDVSYYLMVSHHVSCLLLSWDISHGILCIVVSHDVP